MIIMATVETVTEYVDENVYHSKLYDSASDAQRAKAINQAKITLCRYMPKVYDSMDAVPMADLVDQVLWLLRIDDSLQRAEMGTTSIDIDGMSIKMNEMDRTIAPSILKIHGVTDVRKRRVGSYATPLHDTYRMGQREGWYR